MDPVQVQRQADGVMQCTECGFRYSLTCSEVALRSEESLAAVEEAVRATPTDRLSTRLAPQVWSVNAYTAHLVEAAGVIDSRVRAIAEGDQPTLQWFDENASVIAGNYDAIPAPQSLERLRPVVDDLIAYLRALPPEAWERTGIHSTAGEVRLADVSHDLAHELQHHAADLGAIGVDGRLPSNGH